MTDRTFRSAARLTFYNFIIKDVHTLLPLRQATGLFFLFWGRQEVGIRKNNMISENVSDSCIQIKLKEGSRFCFLLNSVFRQGVLMEILAGASIRQVIVEQLGIAEAYLENRVQTLFLNGKPVDDVDAMTVSDGSTLALSAAMPGLAGATLRKGGKYAAFRQEITLGRDSQVPDLRKGRMVMKLFNQVAEELGPVVVTKGIGIGGGDLLDVIRKAKEMSLLSEIVELTVNGTAIAPEMLAAKISSQSDVFLSIR